MTAATELTLTPPAIGYIIIIMDLAHNIANILGEDPKTLEQKSHQIVSP